MAAMVWIKTISRHLVERPNARHICDGRRSRESDGVHLHVRGRGFQSRPANAHVGGFELDTDTTSTPNELHVLQNFSIGSLLFKDGLTCSLTAAAALTASSNSMVA